MQEQYLLVDENGGVLARRRIVHHLKSVAAEKAGQGALTVRGEWSGLELKLTAETTQEDWRRFEERVQEEMDAWSDFFACLDQARREEV